jgi:hypothetical protein
MNIKNVIHGFIYVIGFFLFHHLIFKEIEHDFSYVYQGVDLVHIFLNFVPLIYFCIGFFLLAIEGIIPLGYTSDGDNRDHIQKLKDFRDSKLGSMSYEKGAKEYLQTAILDSIDDNSSVGKHTRGTRNYINSKLGSMSYEKGLDWIKKGGGK